VKEPAKAAPIGADVNATCLHVRIDGHECVDEATTPAIISFICIALFGNKSGINVSSNHLKIILL